MQKQFQITVDKNKLLSVLQENCATHRNKFEEALEGYRRTVIRGLTKAIQEAKNGKRIRTHFQFTEPFDQTADYNRVIGMLKMSVDDSVTLDEQQYNEYVLDIWAWTNRFDDAYVSNTL